jgi:hypothetical protein
MCVCVCVCEKERERERFVWHRRICGMALWGRVLSTDFLAPMLSLCEKTNYLNYVTITSTFAMANLVLN